MRTITTSKNKTFDVDMAVAPTYDDGCMIQLSDDRRLIEVAEDFDGLEWIRLHGLDGQDTVYTGYTGLSMIQRTLQGKVQMKLIKEV